MKLEVVVEVSDETMLMQQLLLLLFWSLVDGSVTGVGITFCIYTICTDHEKLWKKYIGHSKRNFISAQIFNGALNLHATTHFHCFDILQLKQITFLRILIIFKMKSRFWFWAPHSLTLAVYFTITRNFTLNFSTCKHFANWTLIPNS